MPSSESKFRELKLRIENILSLSLINKFSKGPGYLIKGQKKNAI